MKKYPLRLDYIAKSAIWGGTRLSEAFGKVGMGENIAETWGLSVRSREMCRIQNGEAAGMLLAEYLAAVGAEAVSPTYRLED